MQTRMRKKRLYNDKCKCCLQNGNLQDMWAENYNDGEREIYGEMLAKCFSIGWQKPAYQSEKICDICIGHLRDAAIFKKTVLKSEQELLEYDDDDDESLNEEPEESKATIAEKYKEICQNKLFVRVQDCLKTESFNTHIQPIQHFNIEVKKIFKGKTKLSISEVDDVYDTEPEHSTEFVYVDSAQTEILYQDDKDIFSDENEDFMDVEYLEEDEQSDKEKKVKEIVDSPKNKDNTVVSFRRTGYSPHDLMNAVRDVRSRLLTKTDASKLYHVSRKAITRKIQNTVWDDDCQLPEDEEYTQIGNTLVRKLASPGIESMHSIVKTKKSGSSRSKESGLKTDETEFLALSHQKETACYGERVRQQENIKSVLLYSNATPIRKRGVTGFECQFCSDVYTDAADLKTHTLTSHDSNTRAKCEIEQELSGLYVKLDITNLQCIICDASLHNIEDLLVHLKEHNIPVHTELKNYMIPFKFVGDEISCFICGTEFPFFRSLTMHMNTHYRNFTCELCKSAFVNRRAMKTHALRHIKGTYPCTVCNKVFDNKISMRHHVNKTHKHKHFTSRCKICRARFKDHITRDKHLSEVHGIKRPTYKCNACEKTFCLSKSLSNHIKNFHLKLRPHKCTECDKEFFEKLALNRHMVKHTKLKNYQCSVCLRKFSRRSCVTSHMKIHLDDRSHKCNVCGLGFHQKSNMKKHMRRKHQVYV